MLPISAAFSKAYLYYCGPLFRPEYNIPFGLPILAAPSKTLSG
jgi:hypothetical protein